MNTDDSIHVACAIHSFAKTGESQISPIRPRIADQTESDGECSDVVGAVEFYGSGPNVVKLNSHHDSPVSVGKGEGVSRPDLSAGVPGRVPFFFQCYAGPVEAKLLWRLTWEPLLLFRSPIRILHPVRPPLITCPCSPALMSIMALRLGC